MKDHYQILGISKNASIEEIKKSYRKLALQYHPDRNSNKEAEELFKIINESYSILSDIEERKRYDNFINPSFNNERATKADADKENVKENNPISEDFYEIQTGLSYLFINGAIIKYKGRNINVNDVVAIKFGVRTNNYTPDNYIIHILDKNRFDLKIECNFLFHSKQRVSNTFLNVVTAIKKFVAPIIFNRLLTQIENGYTVHIANCDITKTHISIPKRTFFITKTNQYKWNEFDVHYAGGDIIIISKKARKILLSEPLEDIWNATFLEKLKTYYI